MSLDTDEMHQVRAIHSENFPVLSLTYSKTYIKLFKSQRLKAAVHFTVGRLCLKIGEEHRREFSRQTIAAIAETTFRQCGGSAQHYMFIKTFLLSTIQHLACIMIVA